MHKNIKYLSIILKRNLIMIIQKLQESNAFRFILAPWIYFLPIRYMYYCHSYLTVKIYCKNIYGYGKMFYFLRFGKCLSSFKFDTDFQFDYQFFISYNYRTVFPQNIRFYPTYGAKSYFWKLSKTGFFVC